MIIKKNKKVGNISSRLTYNSNITKRKGDVSSEGKAILQ